MDVKENIRLSYRVTFVTAECDRWKATAYCTYEDEFGVILDSWISENTVVSVRSAGDGALDRVWAQSNASCEESLRPTEAEWYRFRTRVEEAF